MATPPTPSSSTSPARYTWTDLLTELKWLCSRLIKRPPGARYRTVLSIDGGGIRGIIPVMVLQRLENNIKQHILENKDTLIPKDFPGEVTSATDFDIDLTDYFDAVAGTSIGSWIALYIAGRGVGGESVLEDKGIRSRYPAMRRGNIETFRALFHEFCRDVFPRRNIFTTATRVFRSVYPSSGVHNTLRRAFGKATMQDLETGCLVTAYDQYRHAATSFIKGPANGGTSYTVRTDPRERPRAAEDEHLRWRPDLNIQRGTDYYLFDVAAASAAAPTYFPPHTMKRSDIEDGEEMTLVDGGMVSNNPALQVLTFVPEAYECNIRDVALFSVGCGTADPNYRQTRDPGLGWWLASGYLIDIMSNGTSEYLQAIIDFWFHEALDLKYGQYLRIQRSADPDSEVGEMLSSLDGVNNLEALEQIGRDLAVNNDRAMRAFVRDYIFATNETS